jgi:hypothetical protein
MLRLTRWLTIPLVFNPALAGGGGFCRPTDVVVLLDRSADLRASEWEKHIMPFTEALVDLVGPGGSGSTGTRMGVVVFPAAPNGQVGDTSGTAAKRVDMTYDEGAILDALAEGKGECDDNLAAVGLRFPCTSWGFTPTWNALAVADAMLYAEAPSYREHAAKVVVLVTGGVPSSTLGLPHLRASYLTLVKGLELKSKEVPTQILAVGYGKRITSVGSEECEPFCHSGGVEMFAGNHGSGKVSFSRVDTSKPFCSGDAGCGHFSDAQVESLASGGCEENCRYPSDGECDDGGEGAHYQACALGTDCHDCGIRAELKAPHYWAINDVSNIEGLVSSVVSMACSGESLPAPSPLPPPHPVPSPPPPPGQLGACEFPLGDNGDSIVDYSVITEGDAVIESHNHDGPFAIGGALYSGQSNYDKTVKGYSYVNGGVHGTGFTWNHGGQAGAGTPFQSKLDLFKQLTSRIEPSSYYEGGKQYRVLVGDQGGTYEFDGADLARTYC